MGGTINEQYPVGVTKTMVLEGQLRRVIAERDQLRAELAAAKEIAEANWTECEKLRDSMWEYRADNARLRAAVEDAFDGAARQLAEPRNHDDDQYALTAVATTCELAIEATPAQSLAAHDAAVKVAVLREVADREFNPEQSAEERWAHGVLHGNADRIEKEAAAWLNK